MLIRIVRLTMIAATVSNNDRALDLRVIEDAAVSWFSIVTYLSACEDPVQELVLDFEGLCS
jgi:hypothetical protein